MAHVTIKINEKYSTEYMKWKYIQRMNLSYLELFNLSAEKEQEIYSDYRGYGEF